MGSRDLPETRDSYRESGGYCRSVSRGGFIVVRGAAKPCASLLSTQSRRSLIVRKVESSGFGER